MRRMELFAASRGLAIETHIARPNLNDTWPVRVISGRALPTFENSSRDCSVQWKVKPLQKLQRALIKRLTNAWSEPVVMIGTRLDESAARERAMRARGDDGETPRRDADGSYVDR
jgi:3'-phosphoadenosine 5'-phosphosulfate sulfotransferase (PAPS reductase)/FAD synthetase